MSLSLFFPMHRVHNNLCKSEQSVVFPFFGEIHLPYPLIVKIFTSTRWFFFFPASVEFGSIGYFQP